MSSYSLHAAIAGDLDRRRSNVDGERLPVAAASAIPSRGPLAGLRRIGTHEQRRDVGAGGMGDQVFVAMTFQTARSVCVATPWLRSERRGRTGVRLGERRLGSTSPEAIFGSHFSFCSGVPPQRISSPRSPGRVPEQTDADMARLSETTHIGLSTGMPPKSWNGGPGMSSAIFSTTVQRDVFVGEVPFLGRASSADAKRHLQNGSPRAYRRGRGRQRAEFIALAEQGIEAGPTPACYLRRSGPHGGGGAGRGNLSLRQAERQRTEDLAWLIGMPPKTCAAYSPAPIRSA